MTPDKIQNIICAVRGGQESQDTADSAIELAMQTHSRLTFFHVVDAGCLDCGDIARSSAAFRQYLEKAESALQVLQTRARQRGVVQADLMLREGDVRQELRRLAVDTDAQLMLLGHPKPESDRNVFSEEEFHRFLAELDFGGDLRTIQVRSVADNEA